MHESIDFSMTIPIPQATQNKALTSLVIYQSYLHSGISHIHDRLFRNKIKTHDSYKQKLWVLTQDTRTDRPIDMCNMKLY